MKKAVFMGILCVLCIMSLLVGGAKEGTAAPSSTEPSRLVVWCNSVHQQVAEGAKGGVHSTAREFEEKFNVKIEWVPVAWGQMQDKVLRQASLSTGDVDLIFIVNDWAGELLLGMFESLDSYHRGKPIEEFEDIAASMRDVFTLGSQIKAIPYRSNPQILHYNKKYLADMGFQSPPDTFEELIDIAAKTTFKRLDGAQVYGLGIKKADDIISVVKAYGGDVLTHDYKIACTEPETIKALQVLAGMYKAGTIPPNFTELSSADYQNLVNEGLLTIVFFGDNYHLRFIDESKSKVAEDMWFAPIPAAKDSGLRLAPAKNAFWGVGIPINSPKANKELSWEFIRFFASKSSQLQMALNGNGPVRTSVFSDPAYVKEVPYALVTQKILPSAMPPLPTFQGTQEVIDLFNERATEVILGRKDAQVAMEEAAVAIRTVLHREGITIK